VQKRGIAIGADKQGHFQKLQVIFDPCEGRDVA
jgi:hypothetical protein